MASKYYITTRIHDTVPEEFTKRLAKFSKLFQQKEILKNTMRLLSSKLSVLNLLHPFQPFMTWSKNFPNKNLAIKYKKVTINFLCGTLSRTRKPL